MNDEKKKYNETLQRKWKILLRYLKKRKKGGK